jgi:hypothetical protein
MQTAAIVGIVAAVIVMLGVAVGLALGLMTKAKTQERELFGPNGPYGLTGNTQRNRRYAPPTNDPYALTGNNQWNGRSAPPPNRPHELAAVVLPSIAQTVGNTVRMSSVAFGNNSQRNLRQEETFDPFANAPAEEFVSYPGYGVYHAPRVVLAKSRRLSRRKRASSRR